MNISAQYDSQTIIQQLKTKGKLSLRQLKRLISMVKTINQGFYLAYKEGAFSQPNDPEHTWLVKFFCRRLCESLDIKVTLHGTVPTQHALWVANHVSWLDVPVIGSKTKIFFLAKAEIQNWPIFGRLAQAGGTLFIKRGSGDSAVVKEQITGFLNQKIPVLFFPEATTTNGTHIKRLHGKLLAAAIATNTPVQPLVLCYVNEQGALDQVVPFIGDDAFINHLLRVLALRHIHAHLMPLSAIATVGHDIESLTQQLHQAMSDGLVELHHKVLLKQ